MRTSYLLCQFKLEFDYWKHTFRALGGQKGIENRTAQATIRDFIINPLLINFSW